MGEESAGFSKKGHCLVARGYMTSAKLLTRTQQSVPDTQHTIASTVQKLSVDHGGRTLQVHQGEASREGSFIRILSQKV